MRRVIPNNKVKYDYETVLKKFISELENRLGDCLLMVYLTGSYARGDANDNSDLDVFCIFRVINQYVLETVGHCARNMPISYDVLEINTQSLSVDEYKSKIFEDWSEYAVTELNSVLLYGEQIVDVSDINEKIQLSYKKNLANILMSIRHYICVDEPKELLTHEKITTYILKPLTFALRQERFCSTGIYPLSIENLLESYQNDNRKMVEYFINQEKFETDILSNHKEVLKFLHDKIQSFIEKDL
jgi:predicted nucleotidyltransferase